MLSRTRHPKALYPASEVVGALLEILVVSVVVLLFALQLALLLAAVQFGAEVLVLPNLCLEVTQLTLTSDNK